MQNDSGLYGIPRKADPARSTIYLAQGNGHGSTGTNVRRFNTVVRNEGSDITYIDDPVNGASFLINTDGVYSISYSDYTTTTAYAGVTRNTQNVTNGFTTSPTGLPFINLATPILICGASTQGITSSTLPLKAGEVLRAQDGGSMSANDFGCILMISKVSS